MNEVPFPKTKAVLMYHFLYRTRQFKFRDGNDTHPVMKDKEMDDVQYSPSKCVPL